MPSASIATPSYVQLSWTSRTPLGLPGRAGRVDERGEVLRADGADSLLDGVGVLGEVSPAALLQLREGDHEVAVTSAVDDHHAVQLGELRTVLDDLADLRLVLGEDHPAARVGEDEDRVLGARRGVDRGCGGAGTHDREVGEYPLVARRGRDRDPLLSLDAQGEQACRLREDSIGGLLPGDRAPASVTTGVPECLCIGCRGDPVKEHPPHGRRAIRDEGRRISRGVAHAGASVGSRHHWLGRAER